MGTIFQVAELYNRLSLRSIAEEVVKENEQSILDKNRIQLTYGFNSDGDYLNPPYTIRYAAKKRGKAPYGVPDLFNTGAFYSSLLFGDKFRIESNIHYAKHLVKRYGDNIFGISENNIDPYREKFRQKLINILKNV